MLTICHREYNVATHDKVCTAGGRHVTFEMHSGDKPQAIHPGTRHCALAGQHCLVSQQQHGGGRQFRAEGVEAAPLRPTARET